MVLDGLGGGPPDLVIGGGQDLAQLGAGDGAADRDVHVRRQTALRLDGGEVLDVIADKAAQVLDEPVEQRGEVQRIAGGPGVVVDGGSGWCSVAGHPAVGRAGQRDEQRRAEDVAVRGGVGLADRAVADLAARQRRGIMPPPGRAVTARPGGEHRTAHPDLGDLLVQRPDLLVQAGGVQARGGEGVPVGLRLGAVGDQVPLGIVRRVRLDHWFVFQVPALPALGRPERLGAFGARRADGGEGVPAWYEHLLDPACRHLGAAELDRPQARPVLGGQVLDDVAGQRHREPLRAGPPALPRLGHSPPPGSSSALSQSAA